MKSDFYMNQLHLLGTGNRWWSPINLQFTSLLGIVLKVWQHRGLYWSHHCRDDGTANICHKDPPMHPELQLVPSEPVQIYELLMQNHCMGTWALAEYLVAFQIWEIYQAGEAAIQCQKTTRRWRRCCSTCHLMQESSPLSPSWPTMH